MDPSDFLAEIGVAFSLVVTRNCHVGCRGAIWTVVRLGAFLVRPLTIGFER